MNDNTLEKEVEQYLRRKVGNAGGRCLKFVSPGALGVPDRIVLLPGGRILFAELKRPKNGRISGPQWYWQKILTGLGFRFVFVSTRAEVDELMEGLHEV